MMIQAIADRRSIRRFLAQPVSRETIEQVLEAARIAPSSRNDQPWMFLVLGPESRQKAISAMEETLRARMGAATDEADRRKLAGAVHTLRIMKGAPELICVARPWGSHPYGAVEGVERVMELLDAVSVGAAIENMLLEACAMGLGTLWIGNTFLTYDAVCDALGVEGQLLSVIALGYPDEAPAPRPRKSMDEIARFLP